MARMRKGTTGANGNGVKDFRFKEDPVKPFTLRT